MKADMIIGNNILSILKQRGIKQVALADGIGVSKQTVNKMLNGGRMIYANELKAIAEFLGVSTDVLLALPEAPINTDIIHAFMGRVETDEAREALRVADAVSDQILFHRTVRENGLEMMRPAELR